jgi:hypothetical protein
MCAVRVRLGFLLRICYLYPEDRVGGVGRGPSGVLVTVAAAKEGRGGSRNTGDVELWGRQW